MTKTDQTIATKRIAAIDIAKGAAIFLVIWAHCMQYVFKSALLKLIYSIISF